MASLATLRDKLRERIARRDNQTEMIRRTGGKVRGHHRARRRHVAAIRFLRKLIGRNRRQVGRMSEHFHVSEFRCTDGTKVPRASYPALRHLCRNYLEPLRARFGAVHVSSGFRTSSYNASIGGASMSLHIYDYPGREPDAVAADVTCATGTPSEWADFLEGLNPGGLGRYSTFCHVDNRQRVGMSHPARWSG